MTAAASLGLVAHFDLPAGCHLHPMPDDMHAPHLRAGEWAVVDPACREIEPGALYLIEQSNGPIVWQVNTPAGIFASRPGERPCWMLTPLNRPRSPEALDEWLRTGRAVFTSDGPLCREHMKALGKVVGVYVPLVEAASLPAPPSAPPA